MNGLRLSCHTIGRPAVQLPDDRPAGAWVRTRLLPKCGCRPPRWRQWRCLCGFIFVFGVALFCAAAPWSVDWATDRLGGAAMAATTPTIRAPTTSRMFMHASIFPIGDSASAKGGKECGMPAADDYDPIVDFAARTSGILCRSGRQKLRIAAMLRDVRYQEASRPKAISRPLRQVATSGGPSE